MSRRRRVVPGLDLHLGCQRQQRALVRMRARAGVAVRLQRGLQENGLLAQLFHLLLQLLVAGDDPLVVLQHEEINKALTIDPRPTWSS